MNRHPISSCLIAISSRVWQSIGTLLARRIGPLNPLSRLKSLSKLALPLAAASGAAAFAAHARADAVIPAGFAPNVVVTVHPDGSISSVDVSPTPYDGSDDTLIQVNNLSSTPLPSLNLSSTTDIFGFDTDGISAYTGLSSDTTGYGSPDSYFGNIDPSLQSGTVFFTGGISAGGTDYFSLEELVSVSKGSFVVVPPASVPDAPATSGLLAVILAGLAGARRRLLRR